MPFGDQDKKRIRENVLKMQSAGAGAQEIEKYVQSEGLQPQRETPTPLTQEPPREPIEAPKEPILETAKSFVEAMPILPSGQSVSGIKRGVEVVKGIGERIMPTAEKVGMEVFERPSATAREAIREQPSLALTGPLAGLIATSGIAGKKAKEAAMRGVVAPREVKTFQKEAIEKFTPQTRSVLINFIGGLPSNIAGLAADIATSPTEALMSILPATQAGKAVAQTRPALMIKELVNKPISFKSGEAMFLKKAIETPLTKAISPTVRGRKDYSRIKQFKEKAIDAISTVHDNIEGLQLTDSKTGKLVSRAPESLDELSQAVYQTKRAIYNQIDEGLKATGKKGIDIDTNDITDELLKIAYDEKMDIIDPSVRKYAVQQAEAIDNLGRLTVNDTEEIIQNLNQVLNTFYKNPTVDGATKVNVNAMIAKRLRASLDKEVTKATGKNFQPLKDKYGALKTIEEDVAKRAIRDSRKAPSGVIDIPDVFSAGDVARGVLARNPALVTKGGFQLGINAINKIRNDPNRMVKNMFKAMDKIKTRQALPPVKKRKVPVREAAITAGLTARRRNE